jgi:hypothetical protein
MSGVADDPITYSCALEARRETVYFLARLIHGHCAHLRTRRQTRVLGRFRQAVLVLRWFLDGTRIRQLAADNAVGRSTAYTRLHEALDLPAALAPDIHDALAAAKSAGATHVNPRRHPDPYRPDRRARPERRGPTRRVLPPREPSFIETDAA